MKKSAARKSAATGDYTGLVGNIGELLESARRTSARAVNAIMTATYWEIGRHIVEFEQGGKARAHYGERLLEKLSGDLTNRFGRGFGLIQIRIMRQFFVTYPGIRQSVIDDSEDSSASIRQSLIDGSPEPAAFDIRSLAHRFPLSWTQSLARYPLEGLPNQTLVREYRTVLSDDRRLAAEIDAARRNLESSKP